MVQSWGSFGNATACLSGAGLRLVLIDQEVLSLKLSFVHWIYLLVFWWLCLEVSLLFRTLSPFVLYFWVHCALVT